jgi:hypothetical protein
VGEREREWKSSPIPSCWFLPSSLPCFDPQMGMVRDMSNILNLRQRFAPRYAAMRMGARAAAGGSAAAAAAAAAANGGAAADDDNSSDEGWEVVEADEVAGTSTAAGGAVKAEGAEGGADGMEAEAAAEARTEVEMEVEEEAPTALGPGPAGKAALLRKRLREEASPKANEGVWARVQQEMQSRGGFQALMPLFPVRSPPPANVRGPGAAVLGEGSLPWDKQDLKLPAMMRKFSRQEVRAAQAQQLQAASKQARTSIDAAAP